jgi:hypothetical protein
MSVLGLYITGYYKVGSRRKLYVPNVIVAVGRILKDLASKHVGTKQSTQNMGDKLHSEGLGTSS